MKYFKNPSRILAALWIVFSTWSARADQIAVPNDVVSEALAEMDKATMKQWAKLESWQQNNSWINKMAEVEAVGSVYGYAWAGPDVKRFVYPDDSGDWLVIDEITLGGGLGLRIGTTIANLFLMQEFPFLQVGPVKEKTFVSVRRRASYKEALLARPLIPSRLPVNAEALKRMEIGEVVSTVNRGGWIANVGVDPLALLGVKSPVSLGSFGKIFISSATNVNIWRSAEDKANVLIQNLDSTAIGYGIGVGAAANLFSGPVKFGLESKNGFFPLVFNKKTDWKDGTSIVYGFDLKSVDANTAYTELMGLDLSKLQQVLDFKSGALVRELVKKEVTREDEKNFGVNLVLYKRGVRRIQRHSEFDSTLANGKTFKYIEDDKIDVDHRQGIFGPKRVVKKRYTILCPTSVTEPGASAKAMEDSHCVLDVEFEASSDKLKGKDLNAQLIDPIEEIVADANLFPRVREEDSFRELRANVRVRYSLMVMKKFFSTSEDDLWVQLGSVFDLADPLVWQSAASRERWSTLSPVSQLDVQAKTRANQLQNANRLLSAVSSIKKQTDPASRAELLMATLKNKDLRNKLLKLISRVVGRQALVLSGAIQSR